MIIRFIIATIEILFSLAGRALLLLYKIIIKIGICNLIFIGN